MARKRGITKDDVLDAAQARMQTRGYNAVSYADIAGDLGVRAASLHHHFPAKADLATALLARYRRRFGEQLARISAESDEVRRRLERYGALFRETLARDGQICLCGVLGAELPSLPAEAAREVRGFFKDNESWLAEVLRRGRDEGRVSRAASPGELARLVLATFEGAMVVARAEGNAFAFDAIAEACLRLLDRDTGG